MLDLPVPSDINALWWRWLFQCLWQEFGMFLYTISEAPLSDYHSVFPDVEVLPFQPKNDIHNLLRKNRDSGQEHQLIARVIEALQNAQTGLDVQRTSTATALRAYVKVRSTEASNTEGKEIARLAVDKAKLYLWTLSQARVKAEILVNNISQRSKELSLQFQGVVTLDMDLFHKAIKKSKVEQEGAEQDLFETQTALAKVVERSASDEEGVRKARHVLRGALKELVMVEGGLYGIQGILNQM
jgi:hypothetical protein